MEVMGLVFFMAVAQSPLHVAASTGVGNAHAGAGIQVEAGVGPVSVSGAAGAGLALGDVNFAGGLKFHLPGGGWYATASWAAWMQWPPRTESPGAAPYVGDRWHVMSLGVGYRMALRGGFFADVAAGLSRACGRYWHVEMWRGARWSCDAESPSENLYPAFLPDFSLSAGYAFGGRDLAADVRELPPHLAGGLAGAAIDGLSIGLLVASFQLWESADVPALIPAAVIAAALGILRPIVVAVVASLGGDFEPLALFSAVLSDLLGGALLFVGFNSRAPVREVLMASGFGMRTVVTPWVAGALVPRRGPTGLAFTF